MVLLQITSFLATIGYGVINMIEININNKTPTITMGCFIFWVIVAIYTCETDTELEW